jgi:putative MATE family efflux protein
VPAILHSLLQTLVFVVDRVMLGRHGEASLAAMQLGGTLEWSIWSVFAAFEVGAIARVGRHVGARDFGAARRAAWISLGVAAGIGTLLALLSPVALAFLPRYAPSASPDAMREAQGYLGVTVGASPVVFAAMTAIAVLQAGGDTRTPLAIGVGANLVHVVLNRVLILGLGPVPALGARGAGISTAVTFGIIALAAILSLMSRARPVSLRRRGDEAPVSGERRVRVMTEARALAIIAGPAFVERVLYHVGYVSYAGIVARLGDATMAANQSLISVESICFLSGDGFGIAAASLVAQKIGAGQPEQAERAAWIATRYAAITLTVFGILALAFRDTLLPVFTPDHPEVVALGRAAMPVLAAAQPFMAMGVVLAQAIRGAGRTREVLAVSVLGGVVVRLAATAALALGLGMGLVGVWLGSTLDWVARSALLVVLGRRGWGVRVAAEGPAAPEATDEDAA